MSDYPVVQTGYYGKLPQRGDFLRGRLPSSFVQPWDQWWQATLCDLQSTLGDAWQDYYLTCPIYRFVLSPGCFNEVAWMGAFVASVDAVNREFPFAVASPLPEGQSPLEAFSRQKPWFDACDDWLMQMICEESDTLADLNAQCIQFDALIHHSTENCPTPLRILADSNTALLSTMRLEQPELLTQQATAWLQHTLDTFCGAYSLWWGEASESQDASVVLSQNIPESQQAIALFTREWSTQHQSPQPSENP